MTTDPSLRLPANFVHIQSLLEGERKPNSFVNVVGLSIDCQAPIPTKGTDWKSTVTLIDKSVDNDDQSSVVLHIFGDAKTMPIFRCGDIIIVRQAKVQQRQSESPSLMTNRSTVISVFDAKRLSEPSATASSALTVTFPKGKSSPSKNEYDYALKLFRGIDKYRVPTEHKFQIHQIQSRAVKDKFSLLQDVKDFHFYDVIVHVVKEPFDLGDKSTLWVSDYTENADFFNHAFTPTGQIEGVKSDPYGYGADTSSQSQWTGPFGKRSFQISCWEPHASALRTGQIAKGSWVLIRNLQVKHGHNGTNLEGFLREDRDKVAKIGILLLDHLSEPESMDPRLKEAIRRRRDYDRSKRDQLRILEEAAEAGRKRKLHHDMHDLGSRPVKSAKAKRQKNRAERFGKQEEVESKMSNFDTIAAQNLESERTPTADLNSHVRCENHKKAPSTVSEMLQQVHLETDIDGKPATLPLPFVNLNFRADVRVTNFKPSNLQDFAYPKRRVSEYDALSDNEESDFNSEDEDQLSQASLDRREWNWRFFLELEDAMTSAAEQPHRVWVVVDNREAQCLFDLDAKNLRDDSATLALLRERMFTLWGNLEEVISMRAAKQAKARQGTTINGPPPDSSDNEQEAGTEQDVVTNRAFNCCIRQYGIKVTEPDHTKADAGDSKRWQRVFALFGTKISMV